jgi:hypothetical protein
MHTRSLKRKGFLKQANFVNKILASGLLRGTPVFGHGMINSLPHLSAHILGCCCVVGDSVMGTPADHRKWAEECVAMAQATGDQNDKALWLTLAQSWVRLAEHVARVRGAERGGKNGSDALAARSPE